MGKTTATRTIDIGDGPFDLIDGRRYSIQVVAFNDAPKTLNDRLDVDIEGRLDLERPGSDRLFFITSDGFVDVPADLIKDIREVV